MAEKAAVAGIQIFRPRDSCSALTFLGDMHFESQHLMLGPRRDSSVRRSFTSRHVDLHYPNLRVACAAMQQVATPPEVIRQQLAYMQLAAIGR
mgnify:CR=1 FL=1